MLTRAKKPFNLSNNRHSAGSPLAGMTLVESLPSHPSGGLRPGGLFARTHKRSNTAHNVQISVASHQRALNDKDTVIAGLQSLLEDKNGHIHSLQADLKELAADLREMHVRVADIQANFDEHVQAAVDKKTATETSAGSSSSEQGIPQLPEIVQNLTKLNDMLRKHNQRLTRDSEATKTQNSTLSDANRKLKDSNEFLIKYNATLSKKNDALTMTNKEFQAHLEALEKKRNSKMAAESSEDFMDNQILHVSSILENLKRERVELKKENLRFKVQEQERAVLFLQQLVAEKIEERSDFDEAEGTTKDRLYAYMEQIPEAIWSNGVALTEKEIEFLLEISVSAHHFAHHPLS